MGTAADKNGRQPTVLVVGDAARALTRTASPARNRLEYCGSMLDAMALAAEREFAFIYVVMSGFDKPPEAELKLLRQISPASRIVLLAEMHEEASARQVIRDVTNAARPADAYQYVRSITKSSPQATMQPLTSPTSHFWPPVMNASASLKNSPWRTI